ncbi:hypothetical protein PIROE2DRAFT_1672 [Piromyces sp. E2]|nr:hypothetical protein PIROE2DRAFT_1672 [Piromyces sp. E2]|eukprot:OUM70256.1 hypothetical protein PIROE2DRAFT_1672 [Piromyces sp. E2]
MKYHKVWKLLAYIAIICILYGKVNTQQAKSQENNAVVNTDNNNTNTDNNNNNTGNADSGNSSNANNNNNNNNNNSNSNVNNDNNNNDNSSNNKNNDKELEEDNNHGDEEIVPECSSNIGNILFQKPDKKSIVVPYSNFTIIWYYDDRGFEVRYPSNNITFMLFKNEDANYNDYANAWKKPIFTMTVNISEIQPGPERLDGKPVYQWDWDTNFYLNEQYYTEPPTLNAKYKFRIIGDGKDISTNKANYDCYVDGDLTPGSTSPFYIVKNSALGLDYKPLVIENGGHSILKSTKFITSLIISITISLIILL